jgi:hypothetical protein
MAFNNEGIALLWHDQEKSSRKVAVRALRTETPEPERARVRIEVLAGKTSQLPVPGLRTWDCSRWMRTPLARKSRERQQPRAVPHDGAIVNVDDVRARVG